MKRIFLLSTILPALCNFAVNYGEKVADADSEEFFVDSRVMSIRTLGSADRFVDVTYSGHNWDTTGAPNQTARVTVDDEQTLKSSTGEGGVRWVPKTAEVHTLKHICNGATQIVTFEVEGPAVKINRLRDASNRNTIYCEIVCDVPGAVIYYTTDGGNPTEESSVYTGPFIVNPIGGSIVKAMSIAEGYPQSRPVAVIFAPLGIEVVASASSGEFKVDGRAGTDEDLPSEDAEELTFSNLWDGDESSTVTIAQDGAAIFTGLTGEGVKTWAVERNGRYVLTHTTYTNGVPGKVETAVFVVEGKEVPVSELTIDWGQKSFVYDGQPKEPVVTVKDGGVPLEKGKDYDVEYKDNVKVGTAKVIVKGINSYVGTVTKEFTIREPPRVSSVTARQRYPWNGLVDVTVAIVGDSRDVAEASCHFEAMDCATGKGLSIEHVARVGEDVMSGEAWVRKFIWNAGEDVGEVKIDDVSLTIGIGSVVKGGVQLWENGPYWAECNVGASKPEECGYYFWWGDTVGYRRNGDKWVAADGSNANFSFTAENCPTYDMTADQLLSAGYIDSTASSLYIDRALNHLLAKHDAATAHLGAPWRMPTGPEIYAIKENCDAVWTTRNGVYGCLVQGRGSYASRSIFLPAAGMGSESNLLESRVVEDGRCGNYWSSSIPAEYPDFGYPPGRSILLYFTSRGIAGVYFGGGYAGQLWVDWRFMGSPVRPVHMSVAGMYDATTHLALDCRTGDRVSAGTEELTFSNLWDGDANATVTIAQDGAAIFTGLSGEGVKTWTADRNGRYVLTHTTYNNGVAGKVETAVFVVEGKEIPVGELMIDWGQKSFVYDGQPKEPVITVKDGATTLTKGTHYLVEYKDNVNVGMAKAIVKGIEPYVGSVTNTFEIKNRIYENEEIVIEKTDDGWDVTLTNDVYELRFPDNLGVVRVNMNGFSIFGRDADTYGELNPGVLIYPVPEDGNATKMSFVGNGSVCGGSITWNRPDTWGTAGDGICVDDGVREGVVISIGAGLTVWGGGGYATWGGNGVRGYVLSNDGKIYGGEGSVAGAGVKGTVYFNRGTILGGDNSTWMISGEMGTAGVVGIVGCNEGLIIGGEGANDCDSITGDLWAGTAESVGDGEISGAWGNDTFSLPEGLSEEEIVAAARANRNAVSCRYDGNPHAISVPTYEVFKSSVRYSLNRVGPYLAECPKYSDATEVVIWYVNESGIFEPVVTNAAMLSITKGTIPGGGEEPGTGMIPEGRLSKFDRTGVYNGKGQTIDLEKLEEAFADVVGDDFTISFANCESGGQGLSALPPTEGWGDVPPMITDIGELVMWYKVTSPNYEDYVHQAKVTVVQKEITDEMVQPGEDAFFFDGEDKKPTVDVVYEVDGKDICTESDYTLTYGSKADVGWWVTVTGKGNYSGTVTKIVPVLKRPVAPPLVPSRSYNGKTQKPTIPTDERWTVVANPGGIAVGEYSNVVLRLTNTTDYKWKGGAEDQTDITLVFKVTRASNRWTRQPDMKGWAYGETPSEPAMGQALYGTVKVAYRKAGADVSTETAKRPELPGKYLARFWVDETENFIGLATKSPYKDVAFEITGTGPEPSGGVTETTPVPVPHDWLDAYVTEFGGGDYETAANAKGNNGVSLWESYVAGLNPTDATSQFKASITMGVDGRPVITWEPNLRDANPPRVYVEYGKANLGDKDWTPVTDANRAAMRFFKVGVEIK